MILNLKKTLLNNAVLKAVSLIFGYTLWFVLSNAYTTSVWLEVPVCFYDTPEHVIVDAPETVKINLVGKRTDLRNLDMQHLAVHINGTRLKTGHQQLTVNHETLLLPHTINILHTKPSNFIIKTS